MKKRMKSMIVTLMSIFLLTPMIHAEEISTNSNVAKIGEVEYSSITEALNAVKENEEIVLLQNLEKEKIEIKEGQTITLNLNGYSVSSSSIIDAPIINSGNLIIKGSGKITYNISAGIENKQGATLTIEGVTVEGTSSTSSAIENAGNIVINNVTIGNTLKWVNSGLLNEKTGKITINGGQFYMTQVSNYGTLIINDGNFETSNSIYKIENELGLITVNGGKFSSKHTIFQNIRGSLNINGGTFTCETVASNYDPNYLNNKGVESIINVNGGIFNTTGNAFNNTSLSIYSTINIKNGTINSTTKDPILSNYNSSATNLINVTGGTINAPFSSGLLLDSASKFVIGMNDKNISTESPVINIGAGKIDGLGVPTFEFYDGKIVLSKKIDKVLVPEGYKIQYDENEDKTYTAYLVKIETDKPSVEEPPKDNTENTVPPKNDVEDTVENPKTGLYASIVVVLLVLVGSVGCVIVNKKHYFSKI